MLVYIAILAILAVYVRKAIAPKKGDIVIIQTPLHALDDNILLEKQPVIVQDPVLKPNKLIATAFRFLYLFRSEPPPRPDAKDATRVRTRFALLHNRSEEDQTLHIGRSEDTALPVTIPPARLLVLPAGWYFLSETPDAWHTVLLDDLLHRLFFA